MTETTALPEIVSQDEWQSAREALLAKEKELTRAADAVAAERRRLPMVRFDGGHEFEGPQGRVTLLDLFEGRRQLIVYHFMLAPGQKAGCPGCSMVVDNIGHLAHLHARDTTLSVVAPATLPEIERYKERMGWTVPWVSTGGDFNAACDVGAGFGISVFLRDGDEVFRTYFTTDRGGDQLVGTLRYLDLTPFGRQEAWEESGRGTDGPGHWWKLHDEYRV
ncbi:DUF899 domain-containing protein [Amycolatopsis sp. BJA-103]|uniref:DUF899 domain-containing protein n=1 Tax=unclassified Amycolatopsis TaxID=2618356 RepID=UPI000C778C96|nr:DUF899 domain-containing protein [Amycolatopsis sp. BJA-103]AUI57624.1 hypothetical protein BKN51_04895 [Amycolatopsis sp. BJA-103]PNE13856.1 hypothetical protein B1H26_38035 [Amycolatopsis sp. BJA-103]